MIERGDWVTVTDFHGRFTPKLVDSRRQFIGKTYRVNSVGIGTALLDVGDGKEEGFCLFRLSKCPFRSIMKEALQE